MKTVLQTLGYGFIVVIVMGVLSFGPAGTFDYWQAWVLLTVYAVAAAIPTISWGARNPTVLQRRMRGGPAAETRIAQKLASTGLLVSLVAAIVVSALDHRLGWSNVSAAVSVAGDVLVALGLGLGILTVVQNSYAGANIAVEAEQPVVSTGLYGVVRHPMYFSLVIVMAGIPLALGSYWGLTILTLGVLALVVRIDDEERMLTTELAGYRDYTQQVRYRLLPYVW